ncbi:MAG: alpha/beta hydrolase [Reyranellaceae bacterium]
MRLLRILKSAARMLALPFGVAGCSGPDLLSATVSSDGMIVQRDLAYGDNPRHKLDLYLPETGAAAGRRVLVFFYGGGWDSGSKDGYLFAARPFVEAGYIVAIPDYRIYPEVRFPAFVEDGALALRWIADNAARFGGDGSRLYLAGHSAGAHTAALLALDARYLDAVGLRTARIAAVAGLAGPYDFTPNTDTLREIFSTAPDLRLMRPTTYANANAPPMLLATGDADRTVLPKNSINLAKALQAKGAVAELKIYPGIGHVDIAMALAPLFDGKAPVAQDAITFLNRY